MADFVVESRKFQPSTGTWINAKGRIVQASGPREAHKRFLALFENETVKPRMTRILRVVAVGEEITTVQVKPV